MIDERRDIESGIDLIQKNLEAKESEQKKFPENYFEANYQCCASQMKKG